MAPHLCSRSACDSVVDSPQRYCEPHRCTADSCRHARRINSRFCSDHLACLKTGCSTPRYHSDVDEQASPFCADHWYSCRNLECMVSVHHTPNSPFCATHGCQFPACRSPVLTGLHACATHACTFAQCAEPIRNGLRACLNHACQEPGCPYPVYAGRTACTAHICRIGATTCNGIGADYHQGRHYCITHTCDIFGCSRSTLQAGAAPDQAFTKCSQHRCVVQQCHGTRRQDSDYCHNHDLCGKSGCKAVKNIDARFCAAHNNTCIHPSCPDTRSSYGHLAWWDPGPFRSWQSYWVRDGFREHCSNHECVAPDCANIQEYSQGRRFCQQHEVCGKLGCLNARSIKERFCSNHGSTCTESDCYSHLQPPSEYCVNHACAMATSGCTSRREGTRTLCEQHRICAAPTCAAVCISPQVACERHTCYVQSCGRAVCSLDCKYCQHHVCARDGCFYPQDRVDDYSATHTFCSNHKPMPRPLQQRRTRHDSALVYDNHSVIDYTRETNAGEDQGNVEDEDENEVGDSSDDEDGYTTAVIL